jgi:hypothetical protein
MIMIGKVAWACACNYDATQNGKPVVVLAEEVEHLQHYIRASEYHVATQKVWNVRGADSQVTKRRLTPMVDCFGEGDESS